jgi:hypothetical protein
LCDETRLFFYGNAVALTFENNNDNNNDGGGGNAFVAMTSIRDCGRLEDYFGSDDTRLAVRFQPDMVVSRVLVRFVCSLCFATLFYCRLCLSVVPPKNTYSLH